MSRTLPGLQTPLDMPLQPKGCMCASQSSGPSTSVAPSALSPVSTLSPVSDQEQGRKKTSPRDLTGAMSTNDSPTSRPPPENCQNNNTEVSRYSNASQGYKCVPDPQMSMSEVLERYDPSSSSVLEGTATSSLTHTASTSRAAPRIPAYYQPSEDVVGSLVTRDANRIWQVAPYLS